MPQLIKKSVFLITIIQLTTLIQGSAPKDGTTRAQLVEERKQLQSRIKTLETELNQAMTQLKAAKKHTQTDSALSAIKAELEAQTQARAASRERHATELKDLGDKHAAELQTLKDAHSRSCKSHTEELAHVKTQQKKTLYGSTVAIASLAAAYLQLKHASSRNIHSK